MSIDNQILTIQKMVSSAAVVRAYAGGDSACAMLALLDVLIESYTFDLMHVKPEGLERLQAAIQQCQSLRDMVAGDSSDIPKI